MSGLFASSAVPLKWSRKSAVPCMIINLHDLNLSWVKQGISQYGQALKAATEL